MSLYTDLGLTKDATAAEIKKAHRDLVKQHHPDKGGKEEGFERIQHAYEILSNPDSREYYDNTGQEPQKEAGFEESFAQLLEHIIVPMLYKASDYQTRDYIQVIKDTLVRSHQNIEANIKKFSLDGAALTNLKQTRQRMSSKEGGRNLFLEMLDNRIKSLEERRKRDLLQWQEELQFNERCQEELERYVYDYINKHGEWVRESADCPEHKTK